MQTEKNDSVELLKECDSGTKMAISSLDEVNPLAKSMSWLKTNMKIGMDSSDATVADLITDGCDMGIKSLHKYLNQYKDADHSAKAICSRLINIEETLRSDLQRYL